MNSNWILKNGLQATECTSFPYAFRSMYNIVKKGVETGKTFDNLTKSLFIVGPPNLKGDRRTYNYAAATQMAIDQGLLSSDGQLNSKEFKRR